MADSSGGCPPGPKDDGLKDAGAGSTEIIVVSSNNIREHGIRALLETAYHGLYSGTFPLEKGGESLEKWLDHLTDKKSRYDYRIVIAGQHLRNCQQPIIKGISAGVYYKDSDTALLAYIVVHPSARCEGLGKQMTLQQSLAFLDAAKAENRKLRGWFLECNDPNLVGDEDEYGAERRLKKYLGWGARIVPFNYVVPEDETLSQKTDKMTLLAFPHPLTHEYPGRKSVRDFLKSIYANYKIKDFQKDPDYRRITRHILRSAWRRAQAPSPTLYARGDEPILPETGHKPGGP